MGNGTVDSQWPTCVGCAILHRSLNRTGTAVSEVCEACFREFCWDGSLAAGDATYNPGLKLDVKGTKGETSGVGEWRGDWCKVLSTVLAVALLLCV